MADSSILFSRTTCIRTDDILSTFLYDRYTPKGS